MREAIELETRLQRFYQDYKSWLKNGAPHMQPFHRDTGLCGNLTVWACFNNIEELVEQKALKTEMQEQFELAGLAPHFPFNYGGKPLFFEECSKMAAHLNPHRIKWVNDHA